MKIEKCPYCHDWEWRSKFGYLAFETETSQIIVFKEQSKPGRMIVAYKHDHVGEIRELPEEERNKFMKDVCDIANCMNEIYHPDRINYGAYGDTLGHLHFHIVPKYKDGDEWNTTFTMNSGKVMIDDAECEKIAQKYREAYKKFVK